MKTIGSGETAFTKESATELRKELIEMRNKALGGPEREPDFTTAVLLSHVIAYMAVSMEEVFRE